jgi:hypothetical protein
MSSTYAGDPNNYPTSITIPSDGDAIDASSVNTAFEGLADRTAALSCLRVDEFTASGTWECPEGVTKIIVEGCGGGGAGGCGGSGAVGGGGAGGSGGGGAIYHSRAITVVPTTVYTVTRGAGGTPDALGSTYTAGSDGDDSTFGALATFRGAQGGRGGLAYGGVTAYNLGGGPIYNHTNPGRAEISDITDATELATSLLIARDQSGGVGGHVSATSPGTGASAYVGGGPSPVGLGGAGGAANNTARVGGGGGASGCQGMVPGVGGSGGAASSAGSAGTAGTLGAGGGGGGGGGSGAVTAGGLGGAGGNGIIRVIYIGPQAVVT